MGVLIVIPTSAANGGLPARAYLVPRGDTATYEANVPCPTGSRT